MPTQVFLSSPCFFCTDAVAVGRKGAVAYVIETIMAVLLAATTRLAPLAATTVKTLGCRHIDAEHHDASMA